MHLITKGELNDVNSEMCVSVSVSCVCVCTRVCVGVGTHVRVYFILYTFDYKGQIE